MLDFVENYYEVTERNKELLRQKLIDEDIRNYSGHKVNLDFYLKIGQVLGNINDDNPKHTGFWYSRVLLTENEQKKIRTTIEKPLVKVE